MNGYSSQAFTMPSIGAIQGVGRFDPKPDITPLEVLRFCEMFTCVSADHRGAHAWDFAGFVAKHGLQRHFEKLEKAP